MDFPETERGKASLTVEDPWGFVHEDHAETLGIIGLEASYHEFDRGVILFHQSHAFADNKMRLSYHVRHRKASHIKNNSLVEHFEHVQSQPHFRYLPQYPHSIQVIIGQSR